MLVSDHCSSIHSIPDKNYPKIRLSTAPFVNVSSAAPVLQAVTRIVKYVWTVVKNSSENSVSSCIFYQHKYTHTLSITVTDLVRPTTSPFTLSTQTRRAKVDRENRAYGAIIYRVNQTPEQRHQERKAARGRKRTLR